MVVTEGILAERLLKTGFCMEGPYDSRNLWRKRFDMKYLGFTGLQMRPEIYLYGMLHPALTGARQAG